MWRPWWKSVGSFVGQNTTAAVLCINSEVTKPPRLAGGELASRRSGESSDARPSICTVDIATLLLFFPSSLGLYAETRQEPPEAQRQNCAPTTYLGRRLEAN